MQQTFVGRAKSIAGTALIGLGSFVFYENLHQAATQLSHLLGVNPREALGVLPTVILVASQVLQGYGADHSRYPQGCLLHLLASSWPLLLVIVGAILSRDCSTDNVNAFPKKECGLVDLTAGRSTSE
jgi:ascorbate-specific PTS system EIIC-type component UlaA